MKNILTFDVEEWYENFHLASDSQESVKREKRASIGVKKILEILANKNNKATFFIVGKLAEENEELIRTIDREGHEISSHSYAHKPISSMGPAEFEKDLLRSINVLKCIIGKDIIGYRAPGYTITKKTLWALDIIKNCGLKYDSSIYPVTLRLFTRGGIAGYPQRPFLIKENLLEFPLITLSLLGMKFPVATTSYFRVLPYTVTEYAIKIFERQGMPAVLNFHSWEFDKQQPRIKLPFPQDIKHYCNLNKTEDRLKILLNHFDFITCREAYDLCH